MRDSAERTVIVTGASRGLGRAVALRFAAAGDRVAVTYRTGEAKAREVVAAIGSAGGKGLSLRADVRDRSEVEQMAASVLATWGSIDVLVNNAGLIQDALLLRMSDQAWDDVLATNLTGPFHCIRAVTRIMMKQHNGHIINISSISGVQGREGQSNYSAAKAGLIGMTKAVARELGRYNIRSNGVLPGYLETSMGRSVPSAIAQRICRENALGRPNDAAEAAEFIYRLSLMQNVSGQVFNLDSRVL